MKFYDSSMSNGNMFQKAISLQDISEYGKRTRETRKKPEDLKTEVLEEMLLTIPGASNFSWSMRYTVERYGLIDSFLEVAGFSMRSLMTLEGVIAGLVQMNAGSDKLLGEVHQFTPEDYVDSYHVSEPSKVFESKWSWCITLSEKEIVQSFAQSYSMTDASIDALSSSKIKVDSEEELLDLRLLELRSALGFLSVDSESTSNKPFDFILRPLVKCRSERNEVYYIVPFPMLLGSMMQIRVENLIQNSEKIRKEDESSKGKRVETLASDILFQFPNTNMVKSLRYKIGKQSFESDILLILEDSFWAVEVKSHPLFRKIPFEIDRLSAAYAEKVLEGLEQGRRTLDWVSQQNDLLYSLNCHKNPRDMIKGVIVLLDGYVPTLLTQNERFDRTFPGTDIIYDQMKEPVRIYVLTIEELHTLVMQHDKDSFEKFLIWRTNYFRKMPLTAYEEKEYWAFFNNPKNKEMLDNFPKLIHNNNTILYVSGRFSDKDYRREMDESEEAKKLRGKNKDRFDMVMFYCPRCNEVYRLIAKNYEHGLDVTIKEDKGIRLVMSLVSHYMEYHASTREKAFSLLVEDKLLHFLEGKIRLGDGFIGFEVQLTKDEAERVKSKRFLQNLDELRSFLVSRVGMLDDAADTFIKEVGRRLRGNEAKGSNP
nr:hypothetical protein [Candidatus Njordarchaeota archaeon]